MEFQTLSRLAVVAEGAAGGAVLGKWLFAGVFALLVIWLLFIPAHRIGHDPIAPPWWRNVRVWAVVVAVVQMTVYVVWG